MEAAEYKKLFDVEETHWWFKGIRLYFRHVLLHTGGTQEGRVLDAGCGTGGNLDLLSQMFTQANGFDISPAAVAFCRKRGFHRTVVADMNHIPFKDDTFDYIICSDVFECREIDELQSLAELVRISKKGGRMIISVAAYQFLLSDHDKAVHSVRRYTKDRAARIFSAKGVEIGHMQYLFGVFFPFIVMYRKTKSLLKNVLNIRLSDSDVFGFPDMLNNACYQVVKLEMLLSRLCRLPFGTTLLVEIRKL
jgi:SAM-dependent methyltransferase